MSGGARGPKTGRVTLASLAAKKDAGEPIVMVTAYDHPSARIADEVGVDVVLVGDSAANVVLGYSSTVPVTVEEMLMLTRAVRRGLASALLVADLPFGSYEASDADAVRTAQRFVKEGGADAVKLERGGTSVSRARAVIQAGIPVMGHVGLTPQSVHAMGGFKVQGKGHDADRVINDARALEEAGAYAIVLEAIPPDLAEEVTAAVSVPTIGIGAGPRCDGQVLVCYDLLGMYRDLKPKFAKRFAELGDAAVGAMRAYVSEVQERTFPGPEHSFKPNNATPRREVVAPSHDVQDADEIPPHWQTH